MSFLLMAIYIIVFIFKLNSYLVLDSITSFKSCCKFFLLSEDVNVAPAYLTLFIFSACRDIPLSSFSKTQLHSRNEQQSYIFVYRFLLFHILTFYTCILTPTYLYTSEMILWSLPYKSVPESISVSFLQGLIYRSCDSLGGGDVLSIDGVDFPKRPLVRSRVDPVL